MAARLKEVQAVRLTAKLLDQTQKLAHKEKRKLSAMLRILIEEGLSAREAGIEPGYAVPSNRAEAEGLR
jgi:predicted DNA-binding ribbon-helix-helix protein